MNPSVKYALTALLLIACVLAIHRCQRRMGAHERPEVSLYEGLGEAAAAEVNAVAGGDGPWFVVAVESSEHPRFAAMVDSFKDAVSGKVIWHFLPGEKVLGFQNDGWGISQQREAVGDQSGIKGLVLLGGSFRPGGRADGSPPPVLVAGPVPRDVAQSALAERQLSVAIVYKDSPGYSPGASPEDQFKASFEILRAPETP